MPWMRITLKPWRWRRSLSSLAKLTSAVKEGQCLFHVDIFWHWGCNFDMVALVQNSQDTSTTVAGAAWVSAKRRRLWRSLSSAAFLAVALMCATVTCQNDHTQIQIRNI